MLLSAKVDTNALAAELDKAKPRIAELECMMKMTVRRHGKLINEVSHCNALKFSVWKETSAKNADSVISDVKVANTNAAELSVIRNLILARSGELVQALRAPVDANVELKATLTDIMRKIRGLLESCHLIHDADCSVNNLKLTREVMWLNDMIEQKHLELQTVPRLVEETSHLRKELSKLKRNKDRLTVKKKVVFALKTKIFELRTTTDSLTGFLQEVKSCAIEKAKSPKKVQETIAVSDSH